MILGLHGAAQSGKSTAASVLEEAGWIRVKMAGTLKDMTRVMLRHAGVEHVEAHIEGDMKEEIIPTLGVSARHIMQTLGTEWGRGCLNESVWIDITRQRVAALIHAGQNVVIDDIRFDNEADMVRDLGGAVVSIVGRGGISGSHPSEGKVSTDWTMTNQGSLAEWVGKIKYVFLMADIDAEG